MPRIKSAPTIDSEEDLDMPPVNPTQPKASFLALVGFGPVPPEDQCNRCQKGDKMCLVKPGRACLNCNKVKMKCSLTDRLRA